MVKKSLPDFENMLQRRLATTFLQELGYPIGRHTLEQCAHRGQGPAFVKFSNRAYYDRSELVRWADSWLKFSPGQRAQNPPERNEATAAVAA
jgi:hypothetical protein